MKVKVRRWQPSLYAYAAGVRVRLNLEVGADFPAEPVTAWIGLGDKALRVEVTVVDRSETPWTGDPVPADRGPVS